MNKAEEREIWIKNARIITETGIVSGSVMVRGSRIERVVRKAEQESGSREGEADTYVCGAGADIRFPAREIMSAEQEKVIIDAGGLYLSPGFIDIHTHGGGGCDFMDGTLEAIETACRMHLAHGTTSIVPTTLAGSQEGLLSFLALFEGMEQKKEGCPEILGLHLEGPYFAPGQKGAQNPAWLRNPDPKEYMEVLSATNRICRWSFAPELPGGTAFLQELRRRGIVSSLAHSDADCRQVIQACENGLAALTHFYSCMTGVTRRQGFRTAGAIEAGYLLDSLYVEVIADGCHLPGELLSLIYKIKGAERICLVTDSMRAAGMPDGEYLLGSGQEGIRCIKEDGVAKLQDRSAFAGSVATADRLVRTFRRLTDAPLYQAVKMMSLTPATLMGVEERKGSVAEGKDADLLLFDEEIRIKGVMARGKFVKFY